MRRLLGIFVVLVVLTGCGESGVLDFFESGFADGEGDNDRDNGNGGENGELTEEALAGDWSLDRETSTVVLIATWDVVGTVDTDFLRGVLTDPATIAQVKISETTLEFLDDDGVLIVPQFTYQIPTANMIRLTSGTTIRELTTELNSVGTRLTLIDGTTRVVFDIAEGTLGIAEYTLNITQDQFNTSITFNDDTTQDIAETLAIAGSSTIELTAGTTSSINVQATLSNSNDTLQLVFPSSDDRRGIAIFTRQ